MSHLWAAWRAASFLAWSTTCWLTYQCARPLCWLRPGWRRPIKTGLCRAWGRGIARLVGLRIEVRGTPPEPPFLLVCNHLGYLDIVTLMAATPGVFVSRADVAGWPVLGRLARSADTIFIDRSLKRDVARVNALIAAVLEQGRGLIMFPEGTSTGGDDVLPFRSSLLQPAANLDLPVSWASLGYSTPVGAPPASEAVAWWGEMTFGGHFWRLLGLGRVDARLHFGDEAVRGGSRHELARALHEQVAGALPGVRAG